MTTTPVLSGIADQSVSENSAISTVEMRAMRTLQMILTKMVRAIYTYFWDNSSGGSVANTIAVRHYQEQQLLQHLLEYWIDFITIRPMIPAQLGEIKITGTANGASDDEFFVVTVNNMTVLRY